MLESLGAVFLVLLFSYYTLMNFMMMLSVKLLFILMMLLSAPIVIKHLLCSSNQNWTLNLNVTYYETLQTGAGNDLLISMLEKISLFHFTCFITLMLLMIIQMNLFFRLSLQNQIGTHKSPQLLKLNSKKLDCLDLFHQNFFPKRLLFTSINLPYNLAQNTVLMYPNWYPKLLFGCVE